MQESASMPASSGQSQLSIMILAALKFSVAHSSVDIILDLKDRLKTPCVELEDNS